MQLGYDMAIDLGTSSVVISRKGDGILTKEPTVVAIERNTGRLMTVGLAAQRMLGRTPGNIAAVRPMHRGVICDYEVTKRMLRDMVRKESNFSILKPRLLFSIPSGITEVEERAVIEAGMEAGGRRVYLLEAPVAAALGTGADINEAEGRMIVDLGAGTADVAVVSAGGVVTSQSLPMGGDACSEAIVRYIRKKHKVLIGNVSAEELKKSIGCVLPRPETLSMEAKGRCLQTGLPKLITITSEDIRTALEPVCETLLEVVHQILEDTPPELVADISKNGITVTGGGAKLWGIARLLESGTNITTRVADDAELCVAYGLTNALNWLDDMQDGTVNLYRKRQLADI